MGFPSRGAYVKVLKDDRNSKFELEDCRGIPTSSALSGGPEALEGLESVRASTNHTD